jgi:hypothetical protein
MGGNAAGAGGCVRRGPLGAKSCAGCLARIVHEAVAAPFGRGRLTFRLSRDSARCRRPADRLGRITLRVTRDGRRFTVWHLLRQRRRRLSAKRPRAGPARPSSRPIRIAGAFEILNQRQAAPIPPRLPPRPHRETPEWTTTPTDVRRHRDLAGQAKSQTRGKPRESGGISVGRPETTHRTPPRAQPQEVPG